MTAGRSMLFNRCSCAFRRSAPSTVIGTLIIVRHQKAKRPEAVTASGRNAHFTPFCRAPCAPSVALGGAERTPRWNAGANANGRHPRGDVVDDERADDHQNARNFARAKLVTLRDTDGKRGYRHEIDEQHAVRGSEHADAGIP